MAPEYPAFRCLFCHKLFSSRKAVYDHLDHFIPEYCTAYGVKLRQQGISYHPLSVLRYIRSDINRTREIKWELDPTIVPMDGVPWNFAVPVPDKAARDASLREGYHTASWWVDRLCKPRVPAPPPPPPSPPPPAAARIATSAAGHDAGAIQAAANGDINATLDRIRVATNSDIHTNIIDAHRQVVFESDSESDPPPRRHRHRSRRVPVPLTPVRRITPRRVRFIPSPASVSPFMRPSAPLLATVLHVRFFGHLYDVPITRRMDIRDTMAALKVLVPGEWDDGTWSMFGIAEAEGGAAWDEEAWSVLKSGWIEKVGGEGESAWVVMKA